MGRGLRLCVNQAGDRMDEECIGEKVQEINNLTVVASEGYASFVADLQDQTKAVLYDRPRNASIEYFEGKNVFTETGEQTTITSQQARQIYKYLLKNDYIDDNDHVSQEYRDAVENNTLAPMEESLRPMAGTIHKLVQAVYDDKMLAEMFKDGNKKIPAPDNPLNDRFYKEAFQKLWHTINHKYAYTVDFDSEELIRKSIEAIDSELFVSRMQYTVTTGSQREAISFAQMRENDSFGSITTRTKALEKRFK